tara:strand:- start:315 stop:533 length:219 start_codon:yes stop_codon:yes gene_type:complete
MSEEERKERAVALADHWLNKLASRKLMVWISACIFMGIGVLDSPDWVLLSALYIGGQSVIDAVAKIRNSNAL